MCTNFIVSSFVVLCLSQCIQYQGGGRRGGGGRGNQFGGDSSGFGNDPGGFGTGFEESRDGGFSSVPNGDEEEWG